MARRGKVVSRSSDLRPRLQTPSNPPPHLPRLRHTVRKAIFLYINLWYRHQYRIERARDNINII